MNSVYLLIKPLAAVLLLVIIIPRVQGKTQLFQLTSIETGLCLQIQRSKGVFVYCTTKHDNQARNTIFLLSTDSYGNQKLEIFIARHWRTLNVILEINLMYRCVMED